MRVVSDFEVCRDYVWYKVLALPLFIGQLTSAYEGIGCVSTIHAACDSLEFNHYVSLLIFSLNLSMSPFTGPKTSL